MKPIFKLVVFTAILLLSYYTEAQRTRAKLIYKDGKEVKGFGKLIGNNRVKFKASRKDKPQKLDFSLFDRVYIYSSGYAAIYTELSVKNKIDKKIVEIMTEGDKVNLYRIASVGYSTMGSPMGFGGAPTMTYAYSINNFYVMKNGDKLATHLGSNQLFSKNFKKAASEYFKDCPSLVEKIKTKEFKKRDLKTIIDYYNEDCK